MKTELILFDDQYRDLGVLTSDVDFEVGNSSALNNFELHAAGLEAYGFYIEGTEYGGIFEYEAGGTTSEELTLKGWTWRGLLSQSIISPPSGSDYRIVSGDAHTIMQSLIGDLLGGLFTVPATASGCTVSSYQFALYTTTLDGIMDMLQTYGYRLYIHAEKETVSSPIVIYAEAVPAETLEGTFTADSPVDMSYVYDGMGINHLVCMGSGELQQRMRVDLYINAAGQVSTTQYYTGFAERTALYDYTSAESQDDLIKYGTERLLELASSKTIDIHARDENTLEVGDIVTAVKGGVTLTAPIVKKILKIEQGAITQQYKVKGEN